MKKILFFLLLTLPGFSQNFKLPRYEKLVLPNGLTLMLMEQHEVPVLAVSVGLPAGAVYDGTQYGLANLTAESLKFGTKSFPKALLDEKLDFLGAQLSTYATLETATLTSSSVRPPMMLEAPTPAARTCIPARTGNRSSR